MARYLRQRLRSLGPSGATTNALAALRRDEWVHHQIDSLGRRLAATPQAERVTTVAS